MAKKSIIKKDVVTNFGKRKKGQKSPEVEARETVENAEFTEAVVTETDFQPFESSTELPELPELTYEPDDENMVGSGASEVVEIIETAEEIPEAVEKIADNVEPFVSREQGAELRKEQRGETEKTDEVLLADQSHYLELAESELAGDDGDIALATIERQTETVAERRTLSETEQARLDYYESQISAGLRSYLSIGKYLFAIHFEGLHLKDFATWKEYVEEKWKLKSSGALDLIRTYRNWARTANLSNVPEPRLLSMNSVTSEVEKDETVYVAEPVEETNEPNIVKESIEKGLVSGEVLSDADAPSGKAMDELAKFTKHLDQGDMNGEEFEQWQAVATRAFFDFLRETITGEITQKTVADATNVLIEIARLKAVEVDGEHREISAAEILITRSQYEDIMRDKQRIREMLEEKRKNISKPLTQNKDADAGEAAKTLYLECRGAGGHGEQPIFKIMHGSVQLLCSCVYGMPRNSREMVFDERMTKSNPISDEDREKYFADINNS